MLQKKLFNGFIHMGFNHRIGRGSWFALLLIAVLTGCASGPIETENKAATPSVSEVRAELLANDSLETLESKDVLWGGVILSTENLSEATQLEVMGYPLDRRQRPMLGREPEGRFIVLFDGFLEPVDYAEGRSISLLGQISGVTSGTVGESNYDYPAVDARDIHLWNENDLVNKPRVSFGIGVNIGL